MNPTIEQAAALVAFNDGKSIVLEAGAGTGKTSTLKLLAENTERTGLYLAYNKSIQLEAERKFPANVQCRTAHSVAWRAIVGPSPQRKDRLNAGRVPVWEAAKFLGINADIDFGDRLLVKNTLARIVLDTVSNFCRSADTLLTERHVPYQEGLDRPQFEALRRRVLPWAVKAWDDLTQPLGRLKYSGDHYLKQWQLTNPTLDVDFILFDEAQDADPCIDNVVAAQDCQKVYVGDRAQAIYGWRGAVDAMGKFAADSHLYLSQSFRFGTAIAAQANGWLERLDTPLRITGTESIDSVVCDCADARAVLCRTNGGTLGVVLSTLAENRRVHLVGGSDGLERFVKGALDLKVKGRSSHPDLCAFKSWADVQDYANNDPGGSDLKTSVGLVDTYGAEVLLSALARTTSEDQADVVVSTAHKAKGREWDSVRIGADFEQKRKKGSDPDAEPEPLTDADVMLRYVAVTRAIHVLDPGPLAAAILV